jgi:hypothetical protein
MHHFAASNAQPPKSPGGGLLNNIVKFIHFNVIFSKQMSFKSNDRGFRGLCVKFWDFQIA